MEVVRLTAEDADEYQQLRLAGLSESPLGFRSSPSDEAGRTVAEIAARLRVAPDGSACVFGARVGGRLAGVLAFTRPVRAKLAHAAELSGMYVAPESRRIGAGRALLAAAVAHARGLPGLRYLRLVVNASNTPARALYKTFGFVCVGVEPEAVLVAGRYHDEELRVLRLVPDAEPDAADGVA